MKAPVIVAVGEVLWDLLPAGPRAGGAPANFAVTARGLGADARLVSRVGADGLGDQLRHWLADRGLPTDTVQVDGDAGTGAVDVALKDGHPAYTIRPDAAWDFLAADGPARAAVAAADAVCFGTLGQRCEPARAAVRKLVSAARPGVLRVLDVNLRRPFDGDDIVAASVPLANAVKLNDEELPVLARVFGLAGDDRAKLAALAGRFALRLVALTRGANGSVVLAGGEWSELPPAAGPVVDTVGAGDAFTAGLVVGLLSGVSLAAAHRAAADVAAYVCSQPGATPELPDRFRDAVRLGWPTRSASRL